MGQSIDPGARSSGSHGLTGAADSVWMLSAEHGVGTLRARPRDWEESDHSLQRGAGGGWEAVKQQVLEAVSLSSARPLSHKCEAVLQLLKDGAMSYPETAEKLNISKDSARKRLERMQERGLVRR